MGLGAVVERRSQIENIVWVFRGDSTAYFKFLFAMQPPHVIVFSTLASVTVPGAAIAAGCAGADMPARRYEWCLKVCIYVDWSQSPLAAGEHKEYRSVCSGAAHRWLQSCHR